MRFILKQLFVAKVTLVVKRRQYNPKFVQISKKLNDKKSHFLSHTFPIFIHIVFL